MPDVCELDWNCPVLPEAWRGEGGGGEGGGGGDGNDGPLSAVPIDYILVSDCVYEPLYGDSWKALASVIARLSTPGHTVTFCTCERRFADQVDDFIAMLGAGGYGLDVALVEHRELPSTDEHDGEGGLWTPVLELYRIEKKKKKKGEEETTTGSSS